MNPTSCESFKQEDYLLLEKPQVTKHLSSFVKLLRALNFTYIIYTLYYTYQGLLGKKNLKKMPRYICQQLRYNLKKYELYPHFTNINEDFVHLQQ
jgi:hypothetical protein